MSFDLKIENFFQSTISLTPKDKIEAPYFITSNDIVNNDKTGNNGLIFNCLQIKNLYSHIKAQLLEYVIPYLSCFYGQDEVIQHLDDFKLLLLNIDSFIFPTQDNEVPYILILKANSYIFGDLINDMYNYLKYIRKGVNLYEGNKNNIKIALDYKNICYNLFVDILFRLKNFEKCNECIIQVLLEKKYHIFSKKENYECSKIFIYWDIVKYLIDNWLKADENLSNNQKIKLIFPKKNLRQELPESNINLERKLNYVDRNVVFDLDFNNYFDFLI